MPFIPTLNRCTFFSKESTVLATVNPQNGAEIQRLFPSLPSPGETTGVLIIML